MIGNKESILEYDKTYSMLYLLTYLEKSLGGHGNGLVLIKNHKIIFFKKGVEYTVSEIYDELIKKDYDYALFHTRLASIGDINDSNCHPFVNEENDSALAMNGTIVKFFSFANKKKISDTEFLFERIKNLNLIEMLKELIKYDAAFIGCNNGIPFLVKNMGDMRRFKGAPVLYASKFPKYTPCSELRYNNIWIGK